MEENMKKVMLMVGVVSLAASAPAHAKWWDGGIWAGTSGCSNNVGSNNRWFSLLGC
jgi:hypothetical protein